MIILPPKHVDETFIFFGIYINRKIYIILPMLCYFFLNLIALELIWSCSPNLLLIHFYHFHFLSEFIKSYSRIIELPIWNHFSFDFRVIKIYLPCPISFSSYTIPYPTYVFLLVSLPRSSIEHSVIFKNSNAHHSTLLFSIVIFNSTHILN